MKRIVTGVLIMMLGAFLLLNNMSTAWFPISRDIYSVVISWQTLLIAIGIILLADKKADHKTAGVVLILVGTVFLLPKISPSLSMRGIILPLIFIAIGIFFIVKASIRKNKMNDWETWFSVSGENQFGNFEKNTTTKKGGIVHKEYIFSGSKEKWTQGKLNNLSIEAVFSGVILDLSQAELADDIKVAAHIKVAAVFSGVTLYVPEDWNIMIQKTGVFGGFTDYRPNRVLQISSNKLVVLELEAVFGGGEIRCYE